MEAVIQSGSKQYNVAKGDRLLVDKLPGEPGAEITFDQVLLIHGESIKIGTPLVAGAKVAGKILAQKKAKKIIVFKYKRRKGYHKKQGHRQQHTEIEITDIKG